MFLTIPPPILFLFQDGYKPQHITSRIMRLSNHSYIPYIPTYSSVDSKKLEHGCRMMYAGGPYFFGLGLLGCLGSPCLASNGLYDQDGCILRQIISSASRKAVRRGEFRKKPRKEVPSLTFLGGSHE